MENAQQILKKYRSAVTWSIIAAWGLYALIVYLLAGADGYLSLAVAIIVYFVVWRTLIKLAWRKYVSRILLYDLNAPLYREVILAGKFGVNNPLFAMESEFFAGNVTAAMEIGNAALKNERLAKKYAPLTLVLLAEYNLLIGEDEAASYACRRFRELKLPRFKSKRIKQLEKTVEKYEQYLAGDFEALLRPSGKKRKDALYHLVYSYFEARVALCRGEKEKARAAFAGIAVAAENTVIGMLSKSAVESIDSGRDFHHYNASLPNEPTDVGELIKGFEESFKKTKTGLLICFILCAVGLLLMLPDSIEQWQWSREERITARLIGDQYSDIELLGLIYPDDDEILFIATADEGLLLGGRYLDENGDLKATVYGYCPISELENGESYGQAFSSYSGEQLYFRIYGDMSGLYFDSPLYQSAVWTDALGFVFVVVDDKPIELIE